MTSFFNWNVQKDSKVLFNIPHSAVDFPTLEETTPEIALSSEEFFMSRFTLADFGIDEVFKKLNDERLFSFVKSNVSRMWVDVERFDDAREEMNKSGMGVIYEKNELLNDIYSGSLSESVIETRKNLLYRPYHARLDTMVSDMLKRNGLCSIIDLHSYASTRLPYELHGADRRPEICLGWNGDMQSLPLCQQLREGFERLHYDVGMNETFVGSILPNRFIDAQPEGLSSVMIEVRKDLYLNEDAFQLRPSVNSFVKDFEKVLSGALARHRSR